MLPPKYVEPRGGMAGGAAIRFCRKIASCGAEFRAANQIFTVSWSNCEKLAYIIYIKQEMCRCQIILKTVLVLAKRNKQAEEWEK